MKSHLIILIQILIIQSQLNSATSMSIVQCDYLSFLKLLHVLFVAYPIPFSSIVRLLYSSHF